MENFTNSHTCHISQCRKKFDFPDFLIDEHLKFHMKNAKIPLQTCNLELVEPYTCPDCHYETQLKTEIFHHSATHSKERPPQSPPRSRKLTCKKCKFKSSSILVLLGHVCVRTPIKTDQKLFHKEEIFHKARNVQFFECNHCQYLTKYKSCLKSHTIAKHTNYEDIEWFECGQCSYKAKQRGNLNTHMLSKHIKWLHCEQCPFRTKKKSELNTHKRTKHKVEKTVKWLKCEQCLFVTKSKYYLKRHMWSKHGSGDDVKWFKCEQCAYKSKYLGNLKSHVLSKHNQSFISASAGVVNC